MSRHCSALGSGCPRPASLRHSEAKRLELEGKLMEYKKSDAYLMKLKYMKLKKYLKEIDERQKGALLRNQTFLKELDQFEARMKTSVSAMIQKMETLQVGRQAGIITETAMPRGLCNPATVFMGHHTSAVSAAGSLDMQQKPPQPSESHLELGLPSCSPSLGGLGQTASEEVSKQLVSSASDPKPATPEKEQPWGSAPGQKPQLSNWWACKEVSRESRDELLVPASAEEVMPSTTDIPQGMTSPVAGWEQDEDADTAEDSSLQLPNTPVRQEGPLVSIAQDEHRRMLAGLSPVLQLVEDVVVRTSPQHRALYQGEHVWTMGTAEVLSFCNQASSLKEDDLEACEAIVLHQLQALLQSTLNGCLLPEKTLDARGTAVDEKQTRPDLLWDMDVLRTCLSHHASFLKKHQVQLPEKVAEMFESLMVSSEKTQDCQALPVLREVLPEECGDRSSIQSNESSCSLPVIPDDSEEIKQAKHAPRLAGVGEQEVTSWCEDESKEESVVKKIPVAGWDNSDSSSKAKASQEVYSETSSSSKEISPHFSRPETKKGMVMAIKSKAFWGESDESSSEIEAALRPQTHSTEADEFDDFYD